MELYQDLLFLIERKKYNLAIEKLRERLLSNPDDSYLYYLISICHCGIENYSKGIVFIKKALELDSTSSAFLNHYAEIEIENRNYGQSLEILRQSLKIDPNQEEVFLLKSRIELENGKIGEAVEEAKKALALAPDNNFAKNIISLGCIIRKNYSEANQLIIQCLKKDPLDAFSLLNLALIKFFKNEIVEAKEILKQILSRDPENEVIKEGLKQVIISKNLLANSLFKLGLFTIIHKKTFRLLIRVSYRLIVVIGVLIFLNSYSRGLESLLAVIILGFYGFFFLPFKILPQLFYGILFFDPLGKYLLTDKDKIVTVGSLIFFILGAIFFLFYFTGPIERQSDILILGLYNFFLSGILSDLITFQVKSIQNALSLYIIGVVCLVLIYATMPGMRAFSIFLVLISVFIYPFVIKLVQVDNH